MVCGEVLPSCGSLHRREQVSRDWLLPPSTLYLPLGWTSGHSCWTIGIGLHCPLILQLQAVTSLPRSKTVELDLIEPLV